MRSAFVLVLNIFLAVSSLKSQTIVDHSDDQSLFMPVKPLAPATAAAITVSPFAASEITVVAASSSAVSNFLKSNLPDSVLQQLMPIIPFSVVLQNNTDKTVLAYTISWTSLGTDGSLNTDYRTVCDVIHTSSLLDPSAKNLVTILGPQSSFSVGSIAGQKAKLSAQAEAFQHQSAVTISLELVMFDDGTLLGPDHSFSADQILARFQSERDLLINVLSSGPSPVVLSRLEVIRDAAPPGTTLKFAGSGYAQWYEFYQAALARRLLLIQSSQGSGEMMNTVHAIFDGKKYPAARPII